MDIQWTRTTEERGAEQRMTKGVWTAIKYKNEVFDPTLSETDPKKYRPTIYLWTRDTDLKRHRLVIKGFKPYFYVIPAVKSEANEIFNSPEIEKYEEVDFNGRKLYKIYTYIPGFVTKLRSLVTTRFAQAAAREADVLFELRFLIDKGIRGSLEWDEQGNIRPLSEDLNIQLRKVYLVHR
jgi:DNA polymerase elongation subunit (family B)